VIASREVGFPEGSQSCGYPVQFVSKPRAFFLQLPYHDGQIFHLVFPPRLMMIAGEGRGIVRCQARTSIEGCPLDNNEKDWQLYGDHEVFKKCLSDKKFPYVVAVARAANALNSAHSLMLNATGHTPDAERDRINSYLFVSAILYEVLNLIRSMSQTFSKDKSFQSGLRLLLKDPTAKAVERAHLNPARHGAVFHFDAKRFADQGCDKRLESRLWVFCVLRHLAQPDQSDLSPRDQAVRRQTHWGQAVDSPVRYLRDMYVHSEELPLHRSQTNTAAGD
jgi:hypothetical protein